MWFCLDKGLLHLHKQTLYIFLFFTYFIYIPLRFTFTVCATTSHKILGGLGVDVDGWSRERGSCRVE